MAEIDRQIAWLFNQIRASQLHLEKVSERLAVADTARGQEEATGVASYANSVIARIDEITAAHTEQDIADRAAEVAASISQLRADHDELRTLAAAANADPQQAAQLRTRVTQLRTVVEPRGRTRT